MFIDIEQILLTIPFGIILILLSVLFLPFLSTLCDKIIYDKDLNNDHNGHIGRNDHNGHNDHNDHNSHNGHNGHNDHNDYNSHNGHNGHNDQCDKYDLYERVTNSKLDNLYGFRNSNYQISKKTCNDNDNLRNTYHNDDSDGNSVSNSDSNSDGYSDGDSDSDGDFDDFDDLDDLDENDYIEVIDNKDKIQEFKNYYYPSETVQRFYKDFGLPSDYDTIIYYSKIRIRHVNDEILFEIIFMKNKQLNIDFPENLESILVELNPDLGEDKTFDFRNFLYDLQTKVNDERLNKIGDEKKYLKYVSKNIQKINKKIREKFGKIKVTLKIVKS